MDNHHQESRLAYAAAASCVALSHVYFLVRDFRGDKIYLITRAPSTVSMADGGSKSRNRKEARNQLSEIQLQSKSNLPNIDGPLKFWYLLTFVYNAYLTLKYLILCALDSKSMKQYRFLDCLLVGRITLNGRVVAMVKYGGLVLVAFQVGWRIIMLVIKPKFSFAAMEFLMRDPDELIAWEAEKERPKRRLYGGGGGGDSPGTKIELQYSTLLDYKNSYVMLHAHNCQQFVRMRPNRSLKAWRNISRYLLTYLFVVFASFILIFFPLFRMAVAMVFTRTGYRLNYHHCIEWISSQPNKQDYEFIYANVVNLTATPPIGRAFMPLEGFYLPNAYHAIRMFWDFIESALVFGECVISFTFNTGLAIANGLDMLFYCRVINRRVRALIRKMATSSALTIASEGRLRSSASEGSLIVAARSGRSPGEQRYLRREAATQWEHQEQILDIQASIKDLFSQIDRSNSYAATFTLAAITIWFLYSAICASWLFMPDDMAESGRLEWYAIQAIATGYIFLTILCYNAVRRECARLYLSIATLAGLDITASDSGKVDRWLCLMRHYAPVPLAYFTTSRTSPISWLLGVKIFSWLASALFVASGFFVQPHG